MIIRWRRWAAVLVVLVGAYAVLGFWAVPALLRWQLPRVAAQRLERPARVGDVHFNPFTLRLQVQDLRVDDTGGRPFLAVRSIDTALAWRSVTRWAWFLTHLHVDGLSLQLAVAPDGRFNLLAMLDALHRHSSPSAPGAAAPRLVLEDVALTQARIDWDDRHAGVHSALAPLDLHFARLSTLPSDPDAYRLAADIAGGGRLRWRGDGSLSPMRAQGELSIEALPLQSLSAYLKPFARVVVADGRLTATLPYRFTYTDGRVGAQLVGARVRLDNLVAGSEAGQRFAAVHLLQASGIDADLVRRDASVGALSIDGGDLALRRDAQGRWDLAQLLVVRKSGAAPARPAPWKLAVGDAQLQNLALRVVDEQVHPAASITAAKVGVRLKLQVSQADALSVLVEDGSLRIEQLAAQQAGHPPLTLASMAVTGVSLDLARRQVAVQRVALEGGQVQVRRDAQGRIDLAALAPASQPSAGGEPSASWAVKLAQLSLARWAVDIRDEASGLGAQLQDISLEANKLGTDLAQPVAFRGGWRMREGGQVTLQGTAVPSSATVRADVQVQRLALAAAQPALARQVKLKIASGVLNAQGRLEASFPARQQPQVRYTGRLELAGLRLDELDGTLFARWKSVAADRLAMSLRGLEISQLRVIEPEASLIIEADRSFNAARLLVHRTDAPAATAPAATAPAAASSSTSAGAAFPVRIASVRLEQAKLDFRDLSLRPSFGARVYALGGVITDLSTSPNSRARVELDGRVDEFGLARVRGALNPFAPRDNTDLNVVFRNVDMVNATPYAMKFAGYSIAEGRISLDLRYRVKDSRLQGDNQVVIERLTLGERVDSPEATKLPLELALAILKDPNGRIELGLPVSGNLEDPQFSYGAVIWKALVNVLTGVVAAPFRAIAASLGLSGQKMEAIEFDPGSDKLLPPEREKLGQVASVLAKRAQLRLLVPGQFDEALDGAALRRQAVRLDLARRAGIDLRPGEAPGPPDFADRKQRSAVRELYTQRFGADEWAKAKAAAESARPATAASGAAAPLGAWNRLANLVQGEPQVADAGRFYRGLLQRLEKEAPLAQDALSTLGRNRAEAVLAALRDAGVDASRVAAGAPAPVQAVGRVVPLKLELAVR